MQRLLIIFIFCLSAAQVFAQKKYTITADTVRLTGCDSSELIIENHTQAIKGFLYNTGNGLTIFKKGLDRLSDSLFVIGGDTLRYNAWLQGGNRWGRTGVLGTLDNNHLDLYSAGLQQARLASSGNFLIGTTRDTMGSRLQVNGTSFFSDVVSVAMYKQLNVGGININDNPNGRFITSMTSQDMKYTSGLGGYIYFNKSAKIGSDTTIIFSPGGSSNNAITLRSVVAAPSSTTMTFGNLRNDAVKRAVINTADYDAGSLGGSTGIDLYLYPGEEVYSGNQGNIVMGHDGTNQRGNLLLGTSTNNGSKLQVTGSSYLNGPLTVTGSVGGSSLYAMHTRWIPTVNATTTYNDYLYAFDIAPTMNMHADAQQAYPVSIRPTFNLNGTNQQTDGISSALYIASGFGGIRIDQGASVNGNSGQPLFISQTNPADKEAIRNYRNQTPANHAFVWDDDTRSTATQANIVPLHRSTIRNPTAGAGASLTLDRYYYGTEAIIDMHYETTPDSTANINTSMGFYTMTNRAWNTAMYINGGNIGLGIKTPSAQLHTTGSVRLAGLTNDNTQTRVVVSDANGNLFYRTLSTWAVDDVPRSSLAVNGPIKAKSLTLEVGSGGWPDYVFDSSYRLPDLQEVDKYVKAHGHLPGIVSAAEAVHAGIDVGANQAALLKKIEELTLYSIDQQKQLAAQKEVMDKQAQELEDLRKEMREMKEWRESMKQKSNQ